MALINCPECGKEISDRAESCPSCGCPIHTQLQDSEQLSTPVKSKKKLSRKSLILASVVVVALVFVAFFANMNRTVSARANYIKALTDARTTMLIGGADAEKLCNLTKAVWSNTIYEEFDLETDKYTRNQFGFNEDFNTSLAALYADKDTQSTITSIKENQQAVTELMKALQNPSDEFESCYDTVDDMYDAYQVLTGLAISPTGNLTSYSERFGTADTDFMKYYNKLESQIPNE